MKNEREEGCATYGCDLSCVIVLADIVVSLRRDDVVGSLYMSMRLERPQLIKHATPIFHLAKRRSDMYPQKPVAK